MFVTHKKRVGGCLNQDIERNRPSHMILTKSHIAKREKTFEKGSEKCGTAAKGAQKLRGGIKETKPGSLNTLFVMNEKHQTLTCAEASFEAPLRYSPELTYKLNYQRQFSLKHRRLGEHIGTQYRQQSSEVVSAAQRYSAKLPTWYLICTYIHLRRPKLSLHV